MNTSAGVGGALETHLEHYERRAATAPPARGLSQHHSINHDPSAKAAQLKRSTFIDPDTQSVVFQVSSEKYDVVIAQYPSEVQLQIRAYVAGLETAADSRDPVDVIA